MNTPIELPKQIQSLPDKVVDHIILTRFALGAIAIIRKRTLGGQFLEGSSPNPGQYSTTPMPLPFGAFRKKTQNELSKNELQNKSKYRIFKSKESGKTWIIVQGGYKEFRALAGKQNDHVSMTWSGRMMRNLGIVSSTTDGKNLEVGFSDPELSKIAYYHNVAGAGKSHKKKIFFDLADVEKNQLLKIFGEEIMKNIFKSLS